MKVLVIGGTGFTGGHVLERLRTERHAIRCLVRTPSKRWRVPASFQVVEGSLEDAEALDRAMSGVDVLINIASLGFGHAPLLVARAVAAGIRRAVFLSTTAVFTQLDAASKAVRLAAEDTIRSSCLDPVILRPTMIYGTAEDRNICRLIRYLSRFPVLPVAGSGKHRLQPVHVGDLAGVVCAAAFSGRGSGQAYNVSGALPVTFNEVVDTVAELLGRRRWTFHVPAGPVVAGLRWVERCGLRLPIRAEQVLRLNEDKAFSHAAAQETFGFRPRTFREGVREEIEGMGLAPGP